MKKITYFITALFFLLLIANIITFVNGIKISDQLSFYEKNINLLVNKNSDLENRLYLKDSLQYAASIAAQLDFTKTAQPTAFGQRSFARVNDL